MAGKDVLLVHSKLRERKTLKTSHKMYTYNKNKTVLSNKLNAICVMLIQNSSTPSKLF